MALTDKIEREFPPIMQRIEKINAMIYETNMILDAMYGKIEARRDKCPDDMPPIECMEDAIGALSKRSEEVLKLSTEINARIFG